MTPIPWTSGRRHQVLNYCQFAAVAMASHRPSLGHRFLVEQEELLMLSTATNQAAPKAAIWIGRAVSGVVILFLAMDVTMKLANLPVVTEASLQLGWQPDRARMLGVILLA
jgi:hypothetical protein